MSLIQETEAGGSISSRPVCSIDYRETLHLCTNERIMFKLCRKTLSQKRYVWGDLVASEAGLTYPCSWLGVSETLTLLARLGSQSWSPLPSWSLYPDPRNLHEVTSLDFPGPRKVLESWGAR